MTECSCAVGHDNDPRCNPVGMCGRVNIVASHIFPPIPDRSNDWCAHYADREEGPQGFGPTEQAAIRDLIDNYDAPGAR